MVYQCDRCRAALTPGARTCTACGRAFDVPVPADAEMPPSGIDALLEGRTAAGSLLGRSQPPPASLEVVSQRPPRSSVGIVVAVVIAILVVLGGLAGGVYALWTHGPGEALSFAAANRAGNDAYSRGDYATANADYSQMIALRPDRPDGYMLRGICEYQQRFLAEAIADDTAGLVRESDMDGRADFLDNRGQAEYQRGDVRGAIADYTAAEAAYRQITDPDELPSARHEREANLRLRSQAYLAHKDFQQAIHDCNTLINRFNTQPDDFFTRGKAEAAMTHYAAAWADMARAVERDPSYDPSVVALGQLADQTHQYGNAVVILSRETQRSPGNVNLMGSLGWCQYAAGNTAQAEATDRRALSLDPDQGWIGFNLALCYAVDGNGAKASPAYAAALALSTAPERSGAITDLHNALARHPGSPVLIAALAQVQQGPASPKSAPAPAPAPLAAGLSPNVRLSGFSMCPPLGYTLEQSDSQGYNGRNVNAVWSGRAYPDGFIPSIGIYEYMDDGTYAETMNTQQELYRALASATAHVRTTSGSRPFPCTLGGRQFLRLAWSGVGSKTGRKFSGVDYAYVESGHALEIQVTDEEPYSRKNLPILTGSVQTFRKL